LPGGQDPIRCFSTFKALEGSSDFGYSMNVAKVITDPKALPERAVPIPGAKPPVYSLPYKDLERPDEVDSFRRLVREIRRQSPAQPK
ncbi:MAG: hypothetical protein U0Q16_38595, partial [Bryobacteraceae bacterium]